VFGVSEFGAYDYGALFEVTSGGTYKEIHDFGAVFDGINPCNYISMDASGNIYGTTAAGGQHSCGMIWEFTKAGVYKDLHDFGPTRNDGIPYAGVTLDASGNLYGTTQGGGTYELGMVWELTSSGTFEDLHDFGASGDGTDPMSNVSIDPAGNLYGTTSSGGSITGPNYSTGGGMVWEITSFNVYKDVHDFGASGDGFNPCSGVSFDSAGDLYGATQSGGAHAAGMAWKISRGV